MFLLIQNPPASLLETSESGYKTEETSDTSGFQVETIRTPRPFVGASAATMPKTLAVELKKTKRNNFIGITVGRGLDNDVCLNDAKLSKFHGWFFRCSNQWFYTDVGSKNGSAINGITCEARKEYRVQTGDELVLGVLKTVFVSEDLE